MGTNYYSKLKPCECCGRSDEDHTMHIGKSSGGWCFSLHVGPFWEEDINYLNSLESWRTVFNDPDRIILDEYGKVITSEEMMSIITIRSRDNASHRTDEFYRQNSAEPGPNNLLRAKIDGYHCVGHGEGTWDYIQGEFS